jgi:hypothetical protein
MGRCINFRSFALPLYSARQCCCLPTHRLAAAIMADTTADITAAGITVGIMAGGIMAGGIMAGGIMATDIMAGWHGHGWHGGWHHGGWRHGWYGGGWDMAAPADGFTAPMAGTGLGTAGERSPKKSLLTWMRGRGKWIRARRCR